MPNKNILWFSEVTKNDIATCGGKGANLGELTRAKLPVPPGFIVTAQAYFDFIRATKIDLKIKQTLSGVNPEKTKELNAAAETIQKMILSASMPSLLSKEIIDAYQELYTTGSSNIFVAVRSSATAEDLPTASFAGQQKTFLNVSGSEEVVAAVRKCWASLFEARAIYYRTINKFDHLKVGIAVPVQKMIQSQKSGIMFTIDPLTNNRDVVVIEAGWGLGEAIVSGSITPDRYVVNKADLKIIEKNINLQPWKISKIDGETKHVSVLKEEQKRQKLTDGEIIDVARMGIQIERHYQFPQDTEWAIEMGKVYFVQSRPITTLKKEEKPESAKVGQPTATKQADTTKAAPGAAPSDGTLEIILKGAAASLGLASGPVVILASPKEIDKVKKGDIMVTEMTTPDYVPAMKRAAGIITDTGGQTSHAAIVSRELGIPCVVGTGTATHVLKDGQIVSVDGAKGVVYKGKVKRTTTPVETAQEEVKSGSMVVEVPVTATKVYVNLGEPSAAERVAKLPCDGVGLMRAEFMIAELGEHPRALVKAGKSNLFVEKLSEGMRTTASAFHPRPVVYRATDFKTNEYRNLKGGQEFEPVENNPMIGYRGASRYIKEPDLFKLELEAIKRVRAQFDLKNLWLMIPFVRTLEEIEKVIAMVEDYGLRRSNDFKIWMMVEVPSNVMLINSFCEVGIDGVSIGSNDLTQLTLGVDRDNQNMAEDFDERDKAITLAIAHVIKSCRKHHITVSICGQAASTYPEIAELMVREGATSVSVSPDAVIPTRRLIASVETKILLNKTIS